MSLKKGCGSWKAEVVETAKTDFHQTRLKDTHSSIKMDAGHIMELCMYVGRWTPLIEFSGVLRIRSLSLSWAPLTDMIMMTLVVLKKNTIMKMMEDISENSCLNNHIYLKVFIHTKFWRLQIFWQVSKCLKYWSLILFCVLKPRITWLLCVLR